MVYDSDFALQVSSIIYLDSPAGVGFSYSENETDYVTGDIKIAADTHAFLLKVVKETTSRF
jgi:serine carboxypeptidase-like clade I